MGRYRLIRLLTLAPIIAMVSACGGDSSGGVASTPTPPPPPPPPVYTTFKNLTGNQTFNTAAARVQSTNGGLISIPGTVSGSTSSFPFSTWNTTAFTTAPFGNTVTIDYNSAASTYTVNLPDNTSLQFTPADLVTTNTDPNLIAYRNPLTLTGLTTLSTALTILTPQIAGVDLTYTRIGFGARTMGQSGQAQVRESITGVFGVPTVGTDMPVSGTASYNKIYITGTAFAQSTAAPWPGQSLPPAKFAYGIKDSTGSFTANFASGTIQTTINLIYTATSTGTNTTGGQIVFNIPPPISPFGTLTGTGTISRGTPNFAGTMTGTGTFVNGDFSGAFFGPQAAEFGYAFSVVGAEAGSAVFGAMVGAK